MNRSEIYKLLPLGSHCSYGAYWICSALDLNSIWLSVSEEFERVVDFFPEFLLKSMLVSVFAIDAVQAVPRDTRIMISKRATVCLTLAPNREMRAINIPELRPKSPKIYIGLDGWEYIIPGRRLPTRCIKRMIRRALQQCSYTGMNGHWHLGRLSIKPERWENLTAYPRLW